MAPRQRALSRRVGPLALAEMETLLLRIAPDARRPSANGRAAQMEIQCDSPLTETDWPRFADCALCFALMERLLRALIPWRARTGLSGRGPIGHSKIQGQDQRGVHPAPGERRPVLRGFWASPQPLRLLDPMCGRGTTLFVGANRVVVHGHRRRQSRSGGSRDAFSSGIWNITASSTRGSASPSPCPAARVRRARRSPSGDAGALRGKQTGSLTLFICDATQAGEAFGSHAFHLVACDLPYGVQHASQGGSLEKLLARALPGWRGMLKPGGTVAVSFNAQTLKPARVHELMAEAGLPPWRRLPTAASPTGWSRRSPAIWRWPAAAEPFISGGGDPSPPAEKDNFAYFHPRRSIRFRRFI